MNVRERILTIRLMEKLGKYPEQADTLGIIAANKTYQARSRIESEN